MKYEKPVLVVVDVQVGFLNAHSEHVVEDVLRLVVEFGKRKMPIVFTKFRNEPDSPYEKLMNWTNLREDRETALHEALLPKADVVIEKSFYSALTPDFEALAAEHGWRTLIICGVSTESCVLKTAVDAFEKRFTPVVVADACASDLGEEMHRKGLEVIEVLIGIGQVMNIEKLLEQV